VALQASSDDLTGRQVDDVVAALEAAGFTRVETVALGDLITGWLHDEGEVDEIALDGETEFDSGHRVDPDVSIVVSYHSFPEEQEAEPSPKPASTPDAREMLLTAETSPELAALLTVRDNCGADVAAFAEEYAGQTLAFNGNIGAMANHGRYSTRYDILIVAGDFGTDGHGGPTFQYRDVNTTNDLHYVGSNVPDAIGVGDNLRLTARIEGYEEQSCLFLLEPVSTEFR
jgi:hypothetical protein